MRTVRIGVIVRLVFPVLEPCSHRGDALSPYTSKNFKELFKWFPRGGILYLLRDPSHHPSFSYILAVRHLLETLPSDSLLTALITNDRFVLGERSESNVVGWFSTIKVFSAHIKIHTTHTPLRTDWIPIDFVVWLVVVSERDPWSVLFYTILQQQSNERPMDKDSPVRTRHWRYKLNPNKEGARMQQWHELMSIRIKSTDDPTLLFQKISENERKYRHKTKLLTENEKRAIIILLAPEIYTDTIFAVRMQSRVQNYGQEPSLKELRKHMCSYFRVLDTIREKCSDDNSSEYEDVSDEEEGCRKGMIHTKSDEEELKRMGKGKLVATASDDDDDEDDDVRWVPLPYYDKRVNDAREDGSRHNDIQPKTPKRPLSQDSMDSYGSSGSSGSPESQIKNQTESQTDNSLEQTGCLCPLASVEMFGCLCNLSREERMKRIDIVQAEIQRQTKAKRLSETQSTKDTSTKSSSTKSEIVSLPIFSDEEESTMSDLDQLRSEVLSPETLSRIQPEMQPKTLPDMPQEIQPSDQRAMKRISVASGTSYEVWDHRSMKWVSEQDMPKDIQQDIQRETTLETYKRPDPPSHKEHKKDSSMETNLTDLHKKRSSILLSSSQKSLTSYIEDDISDVVKNTSSRSLSSYSQNLGDKSDRSLKSNPSQDPRDKSDKSMKLSDLLENYQEETEENSADIKIADVQKKRDSMAILRKKYDAWMEDDISDVVKSTSNRSLKKKGVERSDSRRSYASSTHDEIEAVVKNKPRRNSLVDVVKKTSKTTRKPITSTNTSDRSLEKIDLETKDRPEGVKVRGWTYETNSSVAENIELYDSRTGHTSWMDDDIVDFVKNTPRNSAVGVVKSTPKASIRKTPMIDSPTESPTDFTLSSSLDVHAFYSPDKSSPYTLKGRKKKTADFAKLRPQPLTMDSPIGDKHPTKILDSERRRDSTSSRSNSTKKKHWLKLATTDKDVLWN